MGVNAFQVEEKTGPRALKVNPSIEQQQRAGWRNCAQHRDQAKVNELLGHLETASRDNDNLMPLLCDLR